MFCFLILVFNAFLLPSVSGLRRDREKKSKFAKGNSQESKFRLAGLFSHNLIQQSSGEWKVGLIYKGELIVGWGTGVLERCDEPQVCRQVCRQALQRPHPPVASRAWGREQTTPSTQQAHSRHTAGTPKGSKKKQKLRSHTYHEGGQDHGWWVVTLWSSLSCLVSELRHTNTFALPCSAEYQQGWHTLILLQRHTHTHTHGYFYDLWTRLLI